MYRYETTADGQVVRIDAEGVAHPVAPCPTLDRSEEGARRRFLATQAVKAKMAAMRGDLCYRGEETGTIYFDCCHGDGCDHDACGCHAPEPIAVVLPA